MPSDFSLPRRMTFIINPLKEDRLIEGSCWSMLLESCMVYGSLTGPSIVETELLFVLIKSIDWAPSWMNRSSYCSHAVVFIQKQMAQLGYIFYFSDQNQWSSKHNNGLKPFSFKICPHLNNRSEKTIFFLTFVLYSVAEKLKKFSHTCSWSVCIVISV